LHKFNIELQHRPILNQPPADWIYDRDSEAHLRRILESYARYYNETRTHLALDKDAPVSRPIQRIGVVKSLAILGGLHHHYRRV
jgi:transposase InsO family protein